MKGVRYFDSLAAAREAMRAFVPRPISAERLRALFARRAALRRPTPLTGCFRFQNFADAQQHAIDWAVAVACIKDSTA